MKTITPQAFETLYQNNSTIDLIDVRTPAEYRELHAVAARNVPLDTLDPAAIMAKRNGSADQPLYVICRSGSRADQACKAFDRAGFEQVVSVEGGTDAWLKAGLPVTRGKKAMSIERQVRIAAGALVVTGALLSGLVNPAFIWLSGLVGAGLAFAGITDTCTMGMLLARMPWNR